MVDLSRFKGIIFDMDGTLVDSMGVHMQAWEITCNHFGYPFNLDYMYGLGGVPTMKTAELLNGKYDMNHDPIEVGQFKKATWQSLDHTPPLIPDTFEVYQRHLGDKKIAVGTGSERTHAEYLLNHHGILENLDALVTASDVEHGKPSPDTFLLAAKNMGLEPQDCVVFEDTQIGLQAAENAGMFCILVTGGKIQLPA